MRFMKGAQTVTIKDVAKLAGVSLSTASRVLSGVGGVSPLLEERISHAANKLAYRPNAAARGLRRSRTSTLGIVFNDLRGPGQLDLLKGIGSGLGDTRFNLFAADANGDHQLYLRHIGRFLEQRVEGLFLVSPINLGDSLFDYQRHEIPVIALLRKDESVGVAPLVAASERHGIQDALDELVRLGHRNVAYILRLWDDRRVVDIERALRNSDLEASRHSLVLEDVSRAAVVDGLGQATRADDAPTALFVQSSTLATVLRALADLRIAVPADLSLISIGASSWHQVLTPGVSAVEADNQAIGRLASDVMTRWISGEQPERTYSQLAVWTPRASVGPPSTRE
jgi:LacI family transcriptional regulator